MILFTTNLSYSFSLKTQSITVSDNSLQNSRATCSVPYIAFLSMIYNIGLPLLSFHMYFLYSLGSSLTINSAIVLLTACECPYPCQLAGRLQICQLPLHIASLASIVHVIIMASIDTVGQLVYALVMYCAPIGASSCFYDLINFFF